jgi:hypothetical protein
MKGRTIRPVAKLPKALRSAEDISKAPKAKRDIKA